jgi:hypothetical protein
MIDVNAIVLWDASAMSRTPLDAVSSLVGIGGSLRPRGVIGGAGATARASQDPQGQAA